MKRVTSFFLCFLLAGSITLAQGTPGKEDYQIKTLLGSSHANGGYGAVSFGYTRIDDHNTFISGIKGGWNINHSLTLGMAGYGFINNLPYYSGSDDHFLTGGFGGLLIEPVFWSRYPVHFTLPMIIGGGGIVRVNNFNYPEWFYYYDFPVTSFFIFIPGMELEMNITKFFRIAIGADYRITPDIRLTDQYGNALVPPDLMRGFSGHIVFKFGKF
jgi:hypothetical protein